MATPALVPDPACLHLLSLEATEQTILVGVAPRASAAACPLCQRLSERIHSRYLRRVADLPWANWAVQVRLHARRFFCDNRGCPRAIFTERLPTVVVPYGRKTLRLVALLTAIGFALGGEAGKRMSQQVGLSSSADTLLAQIRATPLARVSTPRVLGVDDFSFRRGQVFGTILVDLERRKPIDLLPDREAATLASWLRAHPGVKIISRDRGGSYAEGARQGAPEAHQVADRFHLLLNLSEALEGFFLHKKGALKEALHDPTVPAVETAPRQPWHEGKTSTWEATSLCRHQAVVERYHRIHDLAAKRVDSANIARQMGASRRTIYRYLQMDQPPERKQPRPRRGRPHLVEPYKGYLLRRWNEGCRNASLLWREIQAQGYTASLANVGRLLAPLRLHHGKFKAVAAAQCPLPVEAVKKPRPRTALQVARLLTRSPEQRSRDDIAFLRRLCQEDAGIAQTTELVQAFCTILRTRQGDHLDHWLAQVQEQGIPELRSFAQGLRKDYDAVKAGLSLEWSQGQVEGQVHRLKLLKRQMYGRASFPTLRQRVLRRA